MEYSKNGATILFYLILGFMILMQMRIVANRFSKKRFFRYLKEQLPKSMSEKDIMRWRKTSGVLQVISSIMLTIATCLTFYKTHLNIATIAIVLALIAVVADAINTKSKTGVFL